MPARKKAASPSHPPDSVPHRLRTVRERLGLTQTEAAAELMVDRAYLSLLENGHRSPSESFLFRLGFLERVGSLAEFRASHSAEQTPALLQLAEEPHLYKAGPEPALRPAGELIAPDDAMFPEIQSGDVLRLGTAPVRGAIAAVCLRSGEVIIRRWFPTAGGRITLRSEAGKSETLEPGAWQWAKAVKQVTRKY